MAQPEVAISLEWAVSLLAKGYTPDEVVRMLDKETPDLRKLLNNQVNVTEDEAKKFDSSLSHRAVLLMAQVITRLEDQLDNTEISVGDLTRALKTLRDIRVELGGGTATTLSELIRASYEKEEREKNLKEGLVNSAKENNFGSPKVVNINKEKEKKVPNL